MALNLATIIGEYLKSNSEFKYSARELAKWVFDSHPDECEQKKTNSKSVKTNDELLTQLVSEIGASRPLIQKKYPNVKTTADKPRKYYYSDKSDIEEVIVAEQFSSTEAADKFNEYDLYPLLSQYLISEFNVYSKRINEKTSSNKQGPGGNEWLHPDLVGLEDVGKEWGQVVHDCVAEYSGVRTKLWSFEVKLVLNKSNVRKCYFQTVSNSSWANLGYLVVGEINENAEKEARMLASAHGIGLIRLNKEDPTDSELVIPARERDCVDWNAVNRLAGENKDFKDYLILVKEFHQIGKIKKADWDIQKTLAND